MDAAARCGVPSTPATDAETLRALVEASTYEHRCAPSCGRTGGRDRRALAGPRRTASTDTIASGVRRSSATSTAVCSNVVTATPLSVATEWSGSPRRTTRVPSGALHPGGRMSSTCSGMQETGSPRASAAVRKASTRSSPATAAAAFSWADRFCCQVRRRVPPRGSIDLAKFDRSRLSGGGASKWSGRRPMPVDRRCLRRRHWRTCDPSRRTAVRRTM